MTKNAPNFTRKLTVSIRFGVQLGYEGWEASSGFLSHFTSRKGLSSKKKAGESAPVNKEQTDHFTENALPSLLEKYELDDIYNVDEKGLFFYRLLPDRTYAFKGGDCHGSEMSKERVTLLLGANMTGNDKLKPILIGKLLNHTV